MERQQRHRVARAVRAPHVARVRRAHVHARVRAADVQAARRRRERVDGAAEGALLVGPRAERRWQHEDRDGA
eukprot:5957691-Prymnesium_polylepis.1